MRARWGALVKWWRWRWEAWRAIYVMLPAAGPTAVAAAALNLAVGVLPLGFTVGTSVAIGRVAAAGHGDWGAVLAAGWTECAAGAVAGLTC